MPLFFNFGATKHNSAVDANNNDNKEAGNKKDECKKEQQQQQHDESAAPPLPLPLPLPLAMTTDESINNIIISNQAMKSDDNDSTTNNEDFDLCEHQQQHKSPDNDDGAKENVEKKLEKGDKDVAPKEEEEVASSTTAAVAATPSTAPTAATATTGNNGPNDNGSRLLQLTPTQMIQNADTMFAQDERRRGNRRRIIKTIITIAIGALILIAIVQGTRNSMKNEIRHLKETNAMLSMRIRTLEATRMVMQHQQEKREKNCVADLEQAHLDLANLKQQQKQHRELNDDLKNTVGHRLSSLEAQSKATRDDVARLLLTAAAASSSSAASDDDDYHKRHEQKNINADVVVDDGAQKKKKKEGVFANFVKDAMAKKSRKNRSSSNNNNNADGGDINHVKQSNNDDSTERSKKREAELVKELEACAMRADDMTMRRDAAVQELEAQKVRQGYLKSEFDILKEQYSGAARKLKDLSKDAGNSRFVKKMKKFFRQFV